MPQVEFDKRVLLSSINTLTFFSDANTQGRRTRPIPQLKCKGSVCNLYQPYAVTCTNIGGRGSFVQWKCDADLPSSLRFGKIDVNCEGWSRTGDPFILEGSCGLAYDLVKLPTSLRDEQTGTPYGLDYHSYSKTSILGMVAFVVLLLFLLRRCFTSVRLSVPFPNLFNSSSGTGSTNYPPPPPYSSAPSPPPHSKPSDEHTWRPGFWSGFGLGTVGSYLWSNRNNSGPRSRVYDWERPHTAGSEGFGNGRSSAFQTRFTSSDEGMWSGSRSRNTDRGEGPSRLGPMRSASGLARSTVR